MKRNHWYVQLSSGIVIAAAATDALAYLDPGTGSFVLQMIIAGALGALFYIKTAWASIRAYLSRWIGGSPATNHKGSVEPASASPSDKANTAPIPHDERSE